MIVRILGEGQFDVPDEALEELNALDRVAEQAVDQGDDDAFSHALSALLAAVRRGGTALPEDVLTTSQLVLPPADVTIAEVRHLFDDGNEGLVPG